MPDGDDGLDNLNLTFLTLSGNQLTGQIPSWISKLRNLKILSLSGNKISGSIPRWIGDMPSLLRLVLSRNNLVGQIPPQIGFLPALVADDATLDSSYAELTVIGMHGLPYVRVITSPALILSNNSLTGNIPEEIGQLKLLHELVLKNNNLDGKIPDKLSDLVNLEKLDLSMNNLSGQIPKSLKRLSFLSEFNVASNNLEGEIPREGQFEGNPKLCGFLISKSCPMNLTKIKKEDESLWNDEFEVTFAVGCFVAFVGTVAYLFNCSWLTIFGH